MQSSKPLMAVISLFFLFSSGVMAKEPSPETIEGAITIDAIQAKTLWLEGATFIDTRKVTDWEGGRVPGAVHINLKTNDFNPEYIQKFVAKDQPVVSYCNAEKCHRSAKGATKLVQWGWTKVYYFRLGFPAWKNANYPYE